MARDASLSDGMMELVKERSETMKIKIWMDFLCPHCYVGKKQLLEAIQASGQDIDLEIMSYELAPDVHENMMKVDFFEKELGMTLDEIKENNLGVLNLVQEEGLEINIDTLKFSNTRKAHTLLQYFKEKGQAHQFASAVFDAYFIDGAYLSDVQVLISIAKDFGLDEEQVKEIIFDQNLVSRVLSNQKLAGEAGLEEVPYLIFEEEIILSGSQSYDAYLNAIDKLGA